MKKFSLLFIIFSVFLLTTEGSFFDYFQGRDTFQIDQGCTGTKCIGEGETCIPPGTQPAPCLQCSDPFKICEKDAINATELCGCYEDYIECLEKAANFYCDAFATQKSCLSLMTGLENNCTCGTATQRTYTLNSCAFNLRCDNTTSKCAKTLGAGATCGSNTDCGDGNPMSSKLYICNSTTSRCQVLSGWAQVGDSCSTNSDCHGNGERVKCSSGKCVGVTVGGACVDSLDCAFNLYCDPDTMVCANSIAEGSSCNATFADPCQVGTVCGYSGTCIKLFSQAAGASCNTYQECNIGLYCDGTSRLCSAVAAKRSCTIDSDCVGIGGSICECGFDGAKKCQNTAVYYPSECATSLTDLLTCQGENMCKAATIADGSCVTDKCTNQINCYQRCQLEKQQSDKGTGCFGTLPTCATTTSTTGEDNSSNGLLPLSILVTVSLILFAAL